MMLPKSAKTRLKYPPALTYSEMIDSDQTWRALFKADGKSLKEKDIPVRLRRYILLQTEKYRYAQFAI